MITQAPVQVREIAKTLRLFVQPGDIGEIRVIGPGAAFGIYFTHEDIDQAAAQALDYSTTAKGVYLVMNRIAPALSDRPPLVKSQQLTKDADISRRVFLLIDFDPTSPKRGADDSSTDAEKEAARLKMEEVFEWLRALGFPEPIFADSGNGWHILFAIDLPNDDQSRNMIRDFLLALSKRFSDEKAAVDISVHNASRITKLYGTWARKGEHRPDRPHRLSKLLTVPKGMGVVSAELIADATTAALAEATPANADGSLFDRPATAVPRNNGDAHTATTPKLILPETFPVGGRHDTLVRAAGAVRSFGMNEPEILETLRLLNRTRCGSAKPDDELQKIARDFAVKDCNLPMKALVECRSDEEVENARRQQAFKAALRNGLTRLGDGRELEETLNYIATTIDGLTTEANPQTFKVLTSSQLDAADLRTDYLVDDVLVRGQPCVIAASKKSLKTTAAIDLTLSLASCCPFLGKFYVLKASRVALMSGESGDSTIQETARRIARSKPWINLSDYENAIWSFELPRLGQPQTKQELTKFIQDHALEVLIIDPAYLCLELGDDAGNLFSVGKKLRELTEISHATGCTIVIVHHNKKSINDQFAAPELESIAWSGFQEWARQWILLGRREAYDPEKTGSHKLWLSVGGSAGHSGLWAFDIEEGSRKDQGGRRWDVKIQNASAAIAETVEQREQTKANREEKKMKKRIETDSFKLLEAYKQFPTGETSRVIRESAGMSGVRFSPANAKLLESGAVEVCDIRKSHQTFSGFRLKQLTGGTGGTDRDCPQSPGRSGDLGLTWD